ncbi:MAG: PHB depolymerase family esterase [Myxococcota bacterium]
MMNVEPCGGCTRWLSLAVVAWLAGCTAGGAGDSGDVEPPTGPHSSAGCGLAGSGGSQTFTVIIDGTERTYEVQFPTPYSPSTPLALVFYFHWHGGTIADVLALDEPAIWDVPGAATSAVFAWPQGLPDANGEPEWDLSCTGVDMAFFDAMVTAIGDSHCIDLHRVFSTGFSSGADISNALACCRGDVLRAVAPASGYGLGSASSCTSADTPAVRFSYGTADTAYPQSELQDVITWYRGELGCTDAYDIVAVAPCSSTWTGDASTVTCACKSYHGCTKPMVACEFVDMPHTHADGWREDTWAFFSSFP